ncbi:OmpA family protein [Spirosoma linguale]|uniref:OmpA/MotB domain protein n=1 Tax=Spirosoma linguale (strain ATCC 33905 / DSM 74 / LMG 10896 / Claus 1) TaxID=504472 RepID=D2QRL8_SPILD|nr:OmpA/MotB domain protein [Spirosoma linguale DSM 74]
MSTNWKLLIWGVVLWLRSYTAWAQYDSLRQQADRLLTYKAYGRAIEAYAELLAGHDKQLTVTQKAAIQGRLAFAYQQVGDSQKAERYYREALASSPNEDATQTLEYAKTLAGNGKFQESRQQYERYLQLKDKQPARPQPTAPVASPRKEAVRYRLEYLDLNSKGEEFSPAFYRDGLVYVAGQKGGSTIETMGGGGAGYLDLFYVPNRNNLKVASFINADGSTRKVTDNRLKSRPAIGEDSYSRPTANDSRTVPNFNEGISIAEGLGYDDRKDDPVRRFSRTINTKYHEGPATFSKDGLRIIFTRNNYNNGRTSKSAEGVTKLKLYTAVQQNGSWTAIEELPFNSDEYSVGHPTLSQDEQLLYFASDMPGGFGGTDLYVSRYTNGQWGRPVNMGAMINTKGNELFPFVDEVGNLYFSSDGRKGLGGLDIFVGSLINGQSVRSVEPLDAPINSVQDDFGLITDGSRRGGYFSSNRRNGNDDIYRFVRESSLFGCRDLTIRIYDTNTEQPLDSVGVLIKSKGEGQPDRTLMSDANGFLRICLEASNSFTFQASRDGYINSMVGFTTRSLTDDQPSQLEIGLIKPTVAEDTIAVSNNNLLLTATPLTHSRVQGVIMGARDRKPIEGVTVRIRNECDRTQREYVTGPDGRYMFDVNEGCDYTLVASKPAFGTNRNRIRRLPKKTKPKAVSADLRMLSVGDVVTIDNIYYDLDHSSLREDAARELDKVVATMRKYPSLIIEIRSHTDSRGDAERNKALSLQRAKAVAAYLASKGISRKRMATLGMGESQLVNNCTDGVICTEAEHQRNRRTEFRVVEIK